MKSNLRDVRVGATDFQHGSKSLLLHSGKKTFQTERKWMSSRIY